MRRGSDSMALRRRADSDASRPTLRRANAPLGVKACRRLSALTPDLLARTHHMARSHIFMGKWERATSTCSTPFSAAQRAHPGCPWRATPRVPNARDILHGWMRTRATVHKRKRTGARSRVQRCITQSPRVRCTKSTGALHPPCPWTGPGGAEARYSAKRAGARNLGDFSRTRASVM